MICRFIKHFGQTLAVTPNSKIFKVFKLGVFVSPNRAYCLTPVRIVKRGKPVIMKLDSQQFKSVITPEVEVLKDLFSKHGYELRIAGGAVRDLLMNKTPQDLDFATTATPEEMKKMFSEENIRTINMQGEKHGTITPRINDKENFEVTTLRIDVLTDGRHAKVEFTTDWHLDANRRDLTINSMFLGLDGTVYDYFSGYEDLMNKRIIFVGNPDTRIKEDYLRILRYFRFYGRIAADPDNHDADTLKAIQENIEGLKNISGERIWSELKKILEGNFAGFLMRRMIECGAAPCIGLPENPNIQEFNGVCQRTNQKLRAITLLSGLLSSQNDVVTFHGRCKLSAFERDLAFFIVEHRYEKICERPLRPYQQMVVCSRIKQLDILEFVKELLRYKGEEKLLKDFESWIVPRFPISGSVLKEKGVPNGKALGYVLEELKKYWVEKDFTPKEEQLVLRIPEIMSSLGIEPRKNMK